MLDVHLGKLARYLRLLGFDTLYRNDYEDAELARLASAERRILLTRDRDLLKRAVVTHGYYVRAVEPRRQVAEEWPGWICTGRSNRSSAAPVATGLLAARRKQRVWERLPSETRRYIETFWECSECGHLYWEGSHMPHIRRFIDGLRRAPETTCRKPTWLPSPTHDANGFEA